MKIVKIKAFKYSELNEEARANVIHEYWNFPFDYEEKDENGKTIVKYDYFGEWDLIDQIDYCEENEFLFNKYGGMIHHLIAPFNRKLRGKYE